ncbi:MAG: response regulator [Deltaproteobacteria bacterium]|nr:response regulator [Deltaproteobacteria bacterium]
MKKKSLVVDNHPVMLEFMTRFLTKQGYQVMTAEDGLMALDVIQTYTPDIIFVDLIMPNIDGKKLCQIIRGMPRLKDVFLVIVSAIAAEEEGFNHRAFGADLCIAKGPLGTMSKTIQEALHEFDLKGSRKLPDRILGTDGLHARQVTRELLTIKKHYETVLNTLAEGILEITPDGRIVYANPTAIRLGGIPEERLLASHFRDLFQDEDRTRMEEMVSKVLSLSQTVFDDAPLKLQSRQVLVKILPMVEEVQKTVIVVFDDVTDRQRMEAQLQHAQKMEAIGTLAGGIAHDFNNLLMVIQGNISLMLFDHEPSHPFYERLKGMEKQVQSGSRLTGQLLGYARKGRYEVRPLDLNQMLQEAAETFSRTRKDIVIHYDLDPELHPIEADAGQIEQVLMNLFVNAADAMTGGGDMTLKTGNTSHEAMKNKLYNPKPGHYVLFTITDNGIGMDKNTMERIFEPFFTTKEMGRGTGLGLASAYGIIKGHGGFIDVESDIGRGSTFKIYLPASGKKVIKAVEVVEPIKKGRETVLLVDDEDSMLEVGQELLKTMGYHVYTARDGSEALEIYDRSKGEIDIVLLDMIMPKMGGGEAFDQMKKINPAVKVLLLSGYSIDGEAAKILDRGCSGFIQKPFNMEELSKTIESIMGEKVASQRISEEVRQTAQEIA